MKRFGILVFSPKVYIKDSGLSEDIRDETPLFLDKLKQSIC